MIETKNAEQPIVYAIDHNHDRIDDLERLAQAAGCTFRQVSTPDDLPPSEQRDQPGCIIFDHHAANDDLKQWIQWAASHHPPLEMILSVDRSEIDQVIEYSDSCWISVRLRPWDEQQTIELIRTIIRRDRTRCDQTLRMRRVEQSIARLSPRQRRVTGYICASHQNKWIASELNVSQRTIEFERASVLNVFQTGNAIELAALLGEYRGRYPQRWDQWGLNAQGSPD